MARALFFLGRGPNARPLGSLYRATPAEHTSAEPTPTALAALPIGRAVLTATDPDAYTAAVTDLLIAWRAGGFGNAYTGDEEQLANDQSPNVDGTFPGHTASPVPFDPDFRLAYAYDDGRVWLWRAGSWHTLTVTADCCQVVEVVPAARCYGKGYADTAALDLPQLAVWIIAELLTRAADPDTGLSPELRYAAAVNPTRREIRFTVFGVRDDQQYEFPDAPAQGVIAFYTAPIIDAHNWPNPSDPTDRRFSYEVDTPEEYLQGIQRDRRRGPGTVTVIDTDKTGWW